MDILYGKPIAEQSLAETKFQISKLDRKPILGVFCDEPNPYYKGILKDAAYCGIEVQTRASAPDHWAYLHSEYDGIISLIPSFTPIGRQNVDGGLMTPCTAEAIMTMLDYYGVHIKGRNVCIIGRSERVGKPVAKLMLDRDATVTICHRKSCIADHASLADIIVACAGNAGFDRCIIPPDAVVVNVGGDFLEEDKIQCAALIPYIGGVGQVTRAVLMQHVYEKAKRM